MSRRTSDLFYADYLMWLILGFAALGLLIGNLIGLTSEPIVASVLPLIFTAVGGSVIFLLKKLEPADRNIAGQLILTLSLGCLFGTFSGITISERRLLSPRQESVTKNPEAAKAKDAEPNVTTNKYLNALPVSTPNRIDFDYRHHQIDAAEAYDELYKLVNSPQ